MRASMGGGTGGRHRRCRKPWRGAGRGCGAARNARGGHGAPLLAGTRRRHAGGGLASQGGGRVRGRQPGARRAAGAALPRGRVGQRALRRSPDARRARRALLDDGEPNPDPTPNPNPNPNPNPDPNPNQGTAAAAASREESEPDASEAAGVGLRPPAHPLCDAICDKLEGCMEDLLGRERFDSGCAQLVQVLVVRTHVRQLGSTRDTPSHAPRGSHVAPPPHPKCGGVSGETYSPNFLLAHFLTGARVGVRYGGATQAAARAQRRARAAGAPRTPALALDLTLAPPLNP